jgi:hypothetical protein
MHTFCTPLQRGRASIIITNKATSWGGNNTASMLWREGYNCVRIRKPKRQEEALCVCVCVCVCVSMSYKACQIKSLYEPSIILRPSVNMLDV